MKTKNESDVNLDQIPKIKKIDSRLVVNQEELDTFEEIINISDSNKPRPNIEFNKHGSTTIDSKTILVIPNYEERIDGNYYWMEEFHVDGRPYVKDFKELITKLPFLKVSINKDIDGKNSLMIDTIEFKADSWEDYKKKIKKYGLKAFEFDWLKACKIFADYIFKEPSSPVDVIIIHGTKNELYVGFD
jgi:hypothetical protein